MARVIANTKAKTATELHERRRSNAVIVTAKGMAAGGVRLLGGDSPRERQSIKKQARGLINMQRSAVSET
jgi:hypothetical protein